MSLPRVRQRLSPTYTGRLAPSPCAFSIWLLQFGRPPVRPSKSYFRSSAMWRPAPCCTSANWTTDGRRPPADKENPMTKTTKTTCAPKTAERAPRTTPGLKRLRKAANAETIRSAVLTDQANGRAEALANRGREGRGRRACPTDGRTGPCARPRAGRPGGRRDDSHGPRQTQGGPQTRRAHRSAL